MTNVPFIHYNFKIGIMWTGLGSVTLDPPYRGHIFIYKI